MQIIDPGHTYELDCYDGGGFQELIFMKREGEGYPFNIGSYSGTNCQEVIRALIDRTKYLDRQVPCAENQIILASLRSALQAFEIRAARRHKRELPPYSAIEEVSTCRQCGHVGCRGHE